MTDGLQFAAYFEALAQQRHSYGPHVLIVPAAYARLWQWTIELVCPSLRVLQYYGETSHRSALRRSVKAHMATLGTSAAPFHVVITTAHAFSKDITFFTSFK